jgi:D-beta-D-heptose 7-phosphate kinase/D-beta-D-heptose 1-phosphate adenosyltransferase
MTYYKDKAPKILVVGDLMIDHYLWGSTNRISPEAPVAVIDVKKESTSLGGAGNVVNNLSSLNSNVDVISVIGECEASKELRILLSSINVSSKYLITQKNRITSKKSRVIASHQQVVRYDRESSSDISAESEQNILKIYRKIISKYAVILLSDYGKGVLTFSLTKSLISVANQFNKRILVDPKGLDYSKYKNAFLLTPNKKEASEATNIDIEDNKGLKEAITSLKDQCNLQHSLITLSDQGVAIFDSDLRIHPTVTREVFDVTGAGDTVLASLGFALACDTAIDDAIKFANLASGVVIGKIGSATATLNEIIEYETSLNKFSSDKRIKTIEEISYIVNGLKNKNKKIVFTNGCFDILHAGHTKYLENAKNLGDILIVGLNSDASLKRLKGRNRPINNHDDRSYILASLQVVDFVVIFDDDTPIELIKIIKPDILVKGSDYKGKEIVGENIAKEIRLINFIEGKSTTKTIKKIKNFKE